jgi:CheY-like chemotaxis protein
VANELILVVEDNDKNRKLVRDVLTFKGYEIIEAETGEEGVRLAQERHPSLILMDIRLPGDRRDRGAPTAARRGRRLERFPSWP